MKDYQKLKLTHSLAFQLVMVVLDGCGHRGPWFIPYRLAAVHHTEYISAVLWALQRNPAYHTWNGGEGFEYELVFNAEDVDSQSKVVYLHSAHPLLPQDAGNFSHPENTGRVMD